MKKHLIPTLVLAGALSPLFQLTAHAATYYLVASDASNTSSFAVGNGSGWGNAVGGTVVSYIPTAGNSYIVGNSNATSGNFDFRTPVDSNNYTFAGDSLTINASGGTATTRFIFADAGARTITINNLILNGGQVWSTASGTQTLAGNVNLNGTTSFNNSGSINISAAISGTGALITAGQLFLSGNNSYTGGTVITGGSLTVLGTTTLGATTGSVSINVGTLNLSTTASTTVGSLSGSSGSVIYGGGGTNIFTVNQVTSGTFAGQIRGSDTQFVLGSLSTGTLTLTGTGYNSGSYTIKAGTLLVGNGTSGAITGGGAVTVNSGGTLAGSGTIAGKVTVSSGGHFTPGNNGIATTFTTGSLTLSAGSYTDIQLGTANATHTAANTAANNDRTTVTGTLALGGTLNLIDWANSGSTHGSAGAGSYLIFTQTGKATGSFSNIVNLSGYHAKVDSSVSGSVYVDNYQVASANTLNNTVSFGNFHVGDAPTTTRTLTNQASTVLSEGLSVTSLTTGGATVSGVPGSVLAGGASTTLTVGVTGGAGVKDGTVALGLSSDGSASGYGTTALTGQTINVTGTAYNYAAANTLTPTVNVGITHVNGSFGNAAVTVQNTAASGIYTEGLNATKGATTGAATVGGSDISNLAGGAKSTAITVGLSDTATVGAKTGTVTVGFASNGTNSGLSNTTQADQTVTVNGQVNYYADPTLTAVSGGALTATDATHYTLNLGSYNLNTGEYTATISLNNFLHDATYQDLLSGTFNTTGKGLFSLAGFDGTLTAIMSGSNVTLTVSFNTASAAQGDYEGTILFNPTTANTSGTSSLSAVSLGLEFSVVPEPATWAMVVGGMGMLAFGQRLRRRVNR